MLEILEERLDDYQSHYADKSDNDIPLALLKYKPVFKLVKIDGTDDYSLKDEIKVLLGSSRIYNSYLYDESRIYYVCEFTPSYELEYVESFVSPCDHLDGNDSDKLYDWVNEGVCSTELYVCFHCHYVDKLETVLVKDFSKETQEILENTTYSDAYEEVYEYVRCTQLF